MLFDVYPGTSIKDAERINWGSGTGVKFRIIVDGHKIKQWWNFLSEEHNKTSSILYLVGEWTSLSNCETAGSKHLYAKCSLEC